MGDTVRKALWAKTGPTVQGLVSHCENLDFSHTKMERHWKFTKIILEAVLKTERSEGKNRLEGKAKLMQVEKWWRLRSWQQ